MEAYLNREDRLISEVLKWPSVGAFNQSLRIQPLTQNTLSLLYPCWINLLLTNGARRHPDSGLPRFSVPLLPEPQSLIRKPTHFVEHFLPGERKALEKAKLSNEVINDLLEAAESLRGALEHPKASRDIRVGINKLRNETCNAAKEMEELVLEDEQRQRKKAVLRRVFYIVAGAAVLIINSIPEFVVAGGLSPVGQAISGELGKAVMGMGF